MFISPPFLTTRTSANQSDDDWFETVMSGADLPGEGMFPVSAQGAWHGGQHFIAPIVSGAAKSVCSITDGTVIYRRTPTRPPNKDSKLNTGEGDTIEWTDDGVVVIEHTLEMGQGNAATVTFYAIYMHLQSLASTLPAEGGVIKRKAEIGKAGSIRGQSNRIHLEVIASQDQVNRICGRTKALLDTNTDGRTDSVFGEIYIKLPAGTQWMRNVQFRDDAHQTVATAGEASDVAYTSTETLYVGLLYKDGQCTITTYNESGALIGTQQTTAQGEYQLYDLAAARYPDSIDAGYQLMRFGRVLNGTLSPAGAPHWRQVPYQGGVGWVNLNANGLFKFSDADFPHWKGWIIASDDLDSDVRCESTLVHLKMGSALQTMLGRPQGPTAEMVERVKRFICLFPTEWDEREDVIERRYRWLKQIPPVNEASEEAYKKLKEHIKALGFWHDANMSPAEALPSDTFLDAITAASVPPDTAGAGAANAGRIPSKHYHFNAREFIKHLRQSCVWPNLIQTWQTACSTHTLPVDNDRELSSFKKTMLYEYGLRSSIASRRDHTNQTDYAALRALDTGHFVIFGMRHGSTVNANSGNGEWDDRVTLLKKDETGLITLKHCGSYTSEPSGRYMDGGVHEAKKEGGNVGGTSNKDLGRLIADRTYEYYPEFRSGSFGNARFGSNNSFNVLRKTVASDVERFVTNRALNPNEKIDESNAEWIDSSSPLADQTLLANFSEGQTMHFHKGYNGMTGSAGCQTFPPTGNDSFEFFMGALEKMTILENVTNRSGMTAASRYQYVLKKM